MVAAVPFMNDGELYNFARAAGVEAETTKEKLAAGFKAHYASAIAAARQIAKGAPVVVTGHCVVSGAMVSDKPSERGRETGGLESYQGDAFDGADYVALGHLHIPQFVKGFSNVAFFLQDSTKTDRAASIMIPICFIFILQTIYRRFSGRYVFCFFIGSSHTCITDYCQIYYRSSCI